MITVYINDLYCLTIILCQSQSLSIKWVRMTEMNLSQSEGAFTEISDFVVNGWAA